MNFQTFENDWTDIEHGYTDSEGCYCLTLRSMQTTHSVVISWCSITGAVAVGCVGIGAGGAGEGTSACKYPNYNTSSEKQSTTRKEKQHKT